MEYVYHGSKISGLKEIEPRVSTHLQSLVYATKSPCLATIFLRDDGGDLVYHLSGTGTSESPACLVERLPGIFNKIYSNGGSIYTLDGSQFKERDGFWSGEVVAEGKQQVLNEEKIDNVLERLEEYTKTGILKLYHYPDRPDSIPLDNSDLIDRYIKHYRNGHVNSIVNLLNLYPEFTEEVNNRLGKGTSLK